MPLLAEGELATRLGDRERARSAFEDATGREPDNYAARYLLAQTLAAGDPRAARVELDERCG